MSMTPEEMKEELQFLLEETTSALGGTDKTYVELLLMLNEAGTLHVPKTMYPGYLVFFKYKPQSESFIRRNTYYDRFPLVMVTEVYKGGFAGVNLHYLDPIHRYMFYDAISTGLPTINMDQNWKRRLRIDYYRLKSRKKFKFFKPCYKRYLWKGMSRQPVVIPFQIWEDMVMSNTMNFKGAKLIEVFKDTYQKFMGA